MLIGVAPSSCTSKEDVRPDPAPQAPAPDAWNQAAQDAAKPAEDASDAAEPVKSCAERAKALPGPTMVEVPAPDGSTYCMDRTEVTQGQYFMFLEAKGASPGGGPIRGDVTGQPPGCKLNVAYAPDPVSDSPGCRYAHGEPTAYDYLGNHPNHSVGCVDWCDAYMYCQWAGKRLCGRIGGGALDLEESTEATTSQWYNACSQGGKTAYAYGDEFEAGRCVDGIEPTEGVDESEALSLSQDVESKPQCNGSTRPFDQILNLSGSVAEWADGCTGPEVAGSGSCLAYAVLQQGFSFSCMSPLPTWRLTHIPELGFRCCLD
jgi:formylglycine-generating enzyme required for sulfatase activity